MLLKVKGIDVNTEDHYGCNALMWACEVVELSLNGNVTVGETGLMKACKVNSTEIAQMFLDTHRVDVNAADEYGRTALQHACEQKSHDFVELLLMCPGVQVNSATKSDLLLNVAGSDVNIVSETGETALLLAYNSNAKAVVQLLLKV
eukprot:gene27403-33096_t